MKRFQEMSKAEIEVDAARLVGSEVWTYAKTHINLDGLRESCTTMYEFAEVIRDVASAIQDDQFLEMRIPVHPLSMIR
jgi:hypothetical protein